MLALYKNAALLAIACIFVCLFSNISEAEISAQLPGSADAGRFDERIHKRIDKDKGEMVVPLKIDKFADIPETEDGFVLRGVKLEGGSVFSSQELQSLIDEYVGRKVDFNVLNHLAVRITALYRDAGYFISRAVIPEQVIGEDGVVTINIIEGRVNHVIIEDADGLLSSDRLHIIKNTAQRIESLRPLHGPTLERYLLLLNDVQGVFVQGVLRPPQGKDVLPGSVDVVLKVEKTSSEHLVSFDNYGSRFVGINQANYVWATGGVLNTMDDLTVQIGGAFPLSELAFGSMDYSMPLNANGLRGFMNVSYVSSKPGHTLKVLEVESDSTTASLGVSYPVIFNRRRQLSAVGAFNLQNSATEFLDEELVDDKVRYIKTALAYQEGDYDIELELRKGIDFLGATKTGSENLSRAQGRSDFLLFKIESAYRVNLSKGVSLNTKAAAQYTPHALLSSQEFGYGGSEFGRAYDLSEITGDNGVAAAVEVQYSDINFTLGKASVVPFCFYDIGKVWNQEKAIKPESGASAGFGLHYAFAESLYGSVQAAWPLTRTVSTPVMNNDNSPRLLVSANWRF